MEQKVTLSSRLQINENLDSSINVAMPVKKSLSKSALATIYIGSVFFSPFSLYWFFKYKNNPDTKHVAYISLTITFVTLIFMLFTLEAYVQALSGYFELYKSTLDSYSTLY